MKLKTRIISCMLSAFAVLGAVGCGERKPVGSGSESSNKVTILCTAAVGQPTTDNDPYKKYIEDHYGLDVTLVAASDFATTSQLKFSR